MSSHQPWYHGNITRSTAEDLLSKAAKDGSFLLRDSESIQGAYALCVLYQNCVYTYRILPNEEKKLSVQASDGVPIRFFTVLSDLVEAYYKENMGLVTHLQYPVQKEEEPEEEPEAVSVPPLPPRNVPANENRDGHSDLGRALEPARPCILDTYYQRLQHVDMSHLCEDHQKAIQDYFCSAVGSDADQVQNGNPTLPNLKKLITTICKNLNSEISHTLPTLEAIQKLVDQPQSPGGGRLRGQLSVDSSQSVAFRLEQLTKLIYSIEDKTKNAVFDSVGYEGGHRKSIIPPVTFEVKTDSLSISNKMFLKVDVEGGKVYFKKSKDGPEDKYFVHNKILQLVKSQKIHPKLVIVVETDREKTQRKEFVFNDSKKREGFCQLLQQMKNKHSGKPEPDMITIFVGTWNMGNASPSQNISSWFQSKGQGKTRDDTANQIPHDIYVIGTQEDPLGEKEWIDILRGALRDITNITSTGSQWSSMSSGVTCDSFSWLKTRHPTKESQGAIKFMNCVATLQTKSKTKFFIEYHSSCLEKFVKGPDGENQDCKDGCIRVRFGTQVELTPIISDPEYLLDQHILISIKSADCDESYGETCVALRSAEIAYTEFDVKLTHHGECTGTLTGGIQLRTSEGKQTEKLYDFIKVGDDSGASKSKSGDHCKGSMVLPADINNPSYMGYKVSSMSSRAGHGAKDGGPGNISPKKSGFDHSVCSPPAKASSPLSEDGQPPEMFDNPLYGLMGKSQSSKDQENPRKAHLTPPEIFAFPKPPDTDNDRPPPVPTPRNRSYTCSDSKPSSPASTTTASISSNNSLQPQSYSKKPVVPSRSDAGMMAAGKPPLPMKFRPGQPDSQPQPQPQPKPRDYRDTAELPSKIRLPTRLVQPLPKDGHHETPQLSKMGRQLK
uniref:Inositol polyphosphate-5-phosphatase D n=1 Tax=Astyanax mexicanus TaxID=7994 RepID=A0A8B9KSA2_ASTMX